MKCFLGVSNFLEEISSPSHSIVFLFLCIDHLGMLSYLSWCLGSLFTFGQFFVSFFTPAWSLDPLQYVCTTFSKMDPKAEACGCMSTLVMVWGSLAF